MTGGRLEVGESAAQAVIREVAEESGVTIMLTGLSRVYSDPTHVLLDPDGTCAHQQLALCFHAVPASADTTEAPRPDGIETKEAAWYAPVVLANLVIRPAMRLRLHDAITTPDSLRVTGRRTISRSRDLRRWSIAARRTQPVRRGRNEPRQQR